MSIFKLRESHLIFEKDETRYWKNFNYLYRLIMARALNSAAHKVYPKTINRCGLGYFTRLNFGNPICCGIDEDSIGVHIIHDKYMITNCHKHGKVT